MLKSTNQLFLHSYPGIIALVTSAFEGEVNVMAAGCHSFLSVSPPMYGVAIGKERHSYPMIQQSKAFAINFVSADYLSLIETSGKTSGRDGNKLEKLNNNWTVGEKTGAPILEGAYGAYECTVADIKTYGDHDWFAGTIVTFYKDDQMFLENGMPDFSQLAIPLYLGGATYLIAEESTKAVTVENK